jgi:hypothetical protein
MKSWARTVVRNGKVTTDYVKNLVDNFDVHIDDYQALSSGFYTPETGRRYRILSKIRQCDVADVLLGGSCAPVGVNDVSGQDRLCFMLSNGVDSWGEARASELDLEGNHVISFALSYRQDGTMNRMNPETANKVVRLAVSAARILGKSHFTIWTDGAMSAGSRVDKSWQDIGWYPYAAFLTISVSAFGTGLNQNLSRTWIRSENILASSGLGVVFDPIELESGHWAHSEPNYLCCEGMIMRRGSLMDPYECLLSLAGAIYFGSLVDTKCYDPSDIAAMERWAAMVLSAGTLRERQQVESTGKIDKYDTVADRGRIFLTNLGRVDNPQWQALEGHGLGTAVWTHPPVDGPCWGDGREFFGFRGYPKIAGHKSLAKEFRPLLRKNSTWVSFSGDGAQYALVAWSQGLQSCVGLLCLVELQWHDSDGRGHVIRSRPVRHHGLGRMLTNARIVMGLPRSVGGVEVVPEMFDWSTLIQHATGISDAVIVCFGKAVHWTGQEHVSRVA